jgi:hypothetical protein
MSIAEKLTTVAENLPKVYEAGYEKGKTEGGGGSYDEGYTAGLAVGVEQGKQAEYDAFWNTVQSDGTRNNYNSFFTGKGWRSGSFNPKYPINCTSGGYATNMFSNSAIVDTVVPITIVGAHSSVFYNATSLITIRDLNVSGATGTMADWFTGCTKLKNVTFVNAIPVNANFKSSPLSAQSLVNIVEHLSPSVSGKTLTLNSDAVATADWSATNYASWEDLVAQKKPSGWTITLTTA